MFAKSLFLSVSLRIYTRIFGDFGRKYGICEPEKGIFKICMWKHWFGEAKEVALAAKPGMAPLLVIAGACNDPQPHETSVVAENQVIFKDVGIP